MNKFLRISLLSLLALFFSGLTHAAEVTDELTNSTFGITGSQYAETSGIKATSQAVYAAQSAGSNKTIQLRSKNENSGIVTTTSGGKVKSVTIAFSSHTTQARTVDIYGKNSAYSTPADLYTSKQGTLLGSVATSDNVNTVTVSGDYHFIGIRSRDNALYIDKITIVWEEDDVAGTGGNGEEEPVAEAELVTPPANLQTEDWTFEATWKDGYGEEDFVRSIKIGFDNNDVYVQGLSFDFEEAWVKGTLSEDKKSITFASPQFYGSEEYEGELLENYFAAYNSTTKTFQESVAVAYDGEAGTISWDGEVLMLENSTGEKKADPWGYYADINIYKGAPVDPEPVVAPENLVVSEYRLKCMSVNQSSTYEEDGETYDMARAAEGDATEESTIEYDPYEIDVFVGFDGNDVYIKGLSYYLPDAWVKGTLADGKVTIPSSQFYGTYVQSYYGGLFTEEKNIYFKGYNPQKGEETDAMFTFDATTKQLTLDNATWLIENMLKNQFSPSSILCDVTMLPIEEKAVKPANPTVDYYAPYDENNGYGYFVFNMPMVDVNGDNLLLSKLYFKVYTDDEQHVLTFTKDIYTGLTEDMTEVPFTFSDSNQDFIAYDPGFYFYEPLTYKKVGVQSVYYGGGQTNVSDIAWLVINDESGISDLTTHQDELGSVFSLSGMKQNTKNLKKGLYIMRSAEGRLQGKNGKKFVVK